MHSGQRGGGQARVGQTDPFPHRAQRQGQDPDCKQIDTSTPVTTNASVPCQEHRGLGARTLHWAGQAIPGEVRPRLSQQEEPAPGRCIPGRGMASAKAQRQERACWPMQEPEHQKRALDHHHLTTAHLRQASAPHWVSDSSSVDAAGEWPRRAGSGQLGRLKKPRL